MATRVRVVNLKAQMPSVAQARQLLKEALAAARRDRIDILKLIHGYGSSGAGGSLKHAVRASLRLRKKEGEIESYVPGEQWHVCEEPAQEILLDYPDLKKDRDLNRCNEGVSFVVLRS